MKGLPPPKILVDSPRKLAAVNFETELRNLIKTQGTETAFSEKAEDVFPIKLNPLKVGKQNVHKITHVVSHNKNLPFCRYLTCHDFRTNNWLA